MSFKEIMLGDVIHIRHGYAFKSAFFSNKGEKILLTPGNFHEHGGFRLRLEKDRYFIGDIPEGYVLHENDLIVAMTEQGEGLLGSSAWIPESEKYLHNQRLGLIDHVNEGIIKKKYLYYLFNTTSVRGQIRGSASGTKVRHTSPERIYRVKVKIPSILSQEKISRVIDKYNDLIENNHRRIQLLEESARLLYREWFVHLRFPGHEHVKIVDGVPEGWLHALVKDLGQVITGKTPSTNDSGNFGDYIPFVKTPDMHASSIVLFSEEYLSEKGANLQKNKTLPQNSILVACIGAKLGVVSLNGLVCQTNQQINAVVPGAENLIYYSYFTLKGFREQLLAIGGGATMPNVNKSKFESLPIVIPTNGILNDFHGIVEKNFQQIKTLLLTNKKLEAARDLLLPRLMSGEISV